MSLVSFYTACLLCTLILLLAMRVLIWASDQIQVLKLEALHDELFATRGQLYQAAARGEISADSLGFRRTVNAINSMICSREEFGLFAMLAATHRDNAPADIDGVAYFTGGVPEECQGPIEVALFSTAKAMRRIWTHNSNLARWIMAMRGYVKRSRISEEELMLRKRALSFEESRAPRPREFALA